MSDGASSYWKLDETVGATATDAMGVVNGTYTSSPTLGVAGVRDGNTAVSLGTTSRVTTSALNPYSFAGTTPFSVEIWVKPIAAIATNRHLISRDDVFNLDSGWALYLTGTGTAPANRAVFKRNDGGGNYDTVTGTTAMTVGSWYHVVGTYDGSTMRLYVQGAQEGGNVSSSRSLDSQSVALQVGMANGNYLYLRGTVDEPAVYSAALSATAVSDHYNAGKY
jgi:hypothetical protein